MGFLKEAYRHTRKDGAVGVDGQTAQAYAEDLESNLESLLHRFKSGTYHASPVRRVYIPKDDGRSTRPLGIPMAYAYCISLQIRLGIAIAASTSMNSILPAHAV
jgi:retron-type reverse transcriptase